MLAATVAADPVHEHGVGQGAPARLTEGLGNLHHPVSTKNAEAQRFFDQGLKFVFAFNHDEAIRSFRRAAALDPRLAMAHWGAALALGPNINLPADAVRSKEAFEEVRKARALAAGASEAERAYIDALSRRYAADPAAARAPLDRAYKDAMGALVKRWPDDLDAAVLYAEAAMDLRPWLYWNPDGSPAEGTEELVAVLESVLRRDPDHVGAIHFYVHAVEASPRPERALGYAERLPRLAPAAGHLVHMPTHLHLNLGDYQKAGQGNDVAARVDREYIRRDRVTGVYPAMYFNHNLHMAAIAYAMEGRHDDAMRAARELETSAGSMIQAMPGIEFFVPTPLLVQAKFRRWKDVLAAPPPSDGLHATRALWYFGRGMALVDGGQLAAAERELGMMKDAEAKVTAEMYWGLNLAQAVLPIAREQLVARIARAKRDGAGAVAALRRAAEAEDRLAYNEPWDWYLFSRETLGGELLLQRKYGEAEQVFRQDLERHPRNGRSLFGLREALRGQNKTRAAELVRVEFEKAWARAESKLAVADL